MKKNIILCTAYIILIVTCTACGKNLAEQMPSDEIVTLESLMEENVDVALTELETRVEIKSISYAPLPEGWTEIMSEQFGRLYSEKGLMAIVMTDVTYANTATFGGNITDMETYVKNKMSIQYALKLTEPVESEYGNIVNKIVVCAGEPEVEELHYVVISADSSVVIDIIVVNESYTEEIEKFARHISIS